MIDMQSDTYEQFYSEHQSTRREHQHTFIKPLTSLKTDVEKSLADDKRLYDNARVDFQEKYHPIRRLFASSALKHKSSTLQPLKYLYRRRKDLAIKVNNLLQETLNESELIEIRTHWNGSIAVVYDPINGRTEWRECHHGGIHGVYNPHTRTIEWKVMFTQVSMEFLILN